jgi:hypothetical protein
MSEPNQDTTLNYWMDWLDAHRIDYTKIPNKDLVEWMNEMEEAVGDYFMDMVPDEWLDEDVLVDDDEDEDEWEELPDGDDDHED